MKKIREARLTVKCVLPAICEEKLQVSHVDLPQRNAVTLCQRQSDSVHAVIQSPEQKPKKDSEQEHPVVSRRACGYNT